MRIDVVFSWVVLLGAVIISPPARAEEPKGAPPNIQWDSIVYPRIPLALDGLLDPLPTLQNVKGQGLQLTLSCSFQAKNDKDSPAPVPGQKAVVSLHLMDGKIVDPNPDPKRGQFFEGGGPGNWQTFHFDYLFPWQQNLLEEAWIEVRFPKQTFWLEIPYGFTRNPDDPQKPTEERSGSPSLPGSKKLDENDRIIPWRHVIYEVGRIQNNWQLSAYLANPFDAEAELVLYRDDSAVGKSMFLWDLHSPRTAIEFVQADGDRIKSRAMSIRLHEDSMRRSDHFHFNRDPEDSRDWGTATIKVDDKSYSFPVPSSLFKYAHGMADPHNKARLPREEHTGQRQP